MDQEILMECARRAIRLSNGHPLVSIVFYEAGEVIENLNAHCNPHQDKEARNKWLREHPISQLLAHKIKITVCESPDESYRRAERQVEAIINATSNINQEPVEGSAKQCPRDPYYGAVSDPAKLQRIISSGKRLRR